MVRVLVSMQRYAIDSSRIDWKFSFHIAVDVPLVEGPACTATDQLQPIND